jgi:hypothetical protein
MNGETRDIVDRRWKEYGLDRISKSLTPDGWSGQCGRF